jgi:hypothetical protein
LQAEKTAFQSFSRLFHCGKLLQQLTLGAFLTVFAKTKFLCRFVADEARSVAKNRHKCHTNHAQMTSFQRSTRHDSCGRRSGAASGFGQLPFSNNHIGHEGVAGCNVHCIMLVKRCTIAPRSSATSSAAPRVGFPEHHVQKRISACDVAIRGLTRAETIKPKGFGKECSYGITRSETEKIWYPGGILERMGERKTARCYLVGE